MKTNKYGLFGSLKAKTGKGNDLQQILLEASQMVSQAKGCHLYIVGKDTTNEDVIWINEIWDSKEDHDNSLNVPGVRELIGRAMPIIDGSPERGTVVEIIGGYGIG
jgi:quinol monooxygenase YgiN